MNIYIPKSISVISPSVCEVTYDTANGIRVCKYTASKIEAGKSVIYDCNDVEYWQHTSASDALLAFNQKTMGGLFLLNSHDLEDSVPKIKSIAVINETEEAPNFEIVFECPKMSIVCQLSRDNDLIIKSSNKLPPYFDILDNKQTLIKMLAAFEMAYWAKS